MGDVIETTEGASVIVQLSDESSLEMRENTQLDVAELRQTTTNARVSRIKLAWGGIRATLSPGHQEVGSSFQIETPNAVIGGKFSQSDVEVSYNPSTQETIGLAHTVELIAKNLLTDEEALVPIGSTVIIVGTTIKIVTALLALSELSGTQSAASTTKNIASQGAKTGMRTGTKILIGTGATVLVGGAVAAGVILVNEAQEEPLSFTGTYRGGGAQNSTHYRFNVYSLVQNSDTSVTGNYEHSAGHVNPECTTYHSLPIQGTLNGDQVSWAWPSRQECCWRQQLDPDTLCCSRVEGGSYTATLEGSGTVLNVSGPSCSLTNTNSDYDCVATGTMFKQ